MKSNNGREMTFNTLAILIICIRTSWCLVELVNEDCPNEDVDPHDMGTYLHSAKCNQAPRIPTGAGNYQEREIDEVKVKRAVYLSQINPTDVKNSQNLSPFSPYNEYDSSAVAQHHEPNVHEVLAGGGVGGLPFLEFTETTTKYSTPECKCPTIDQTPLMKYIRRIVGSLLEQMGVHNHHFGPDETITIDLRGEISYQSYMDLTLFIYSDDGQESSKMLQTVSEIMSNLLQPNAQPMEPISFSFETSHFLFPMLTTPKFWLIVLSLSLTAFTIIFLFCLILQARHSPWKLLVYSAMLFFVFSCIWIYAEKYEKAMADNAARQKQYEDIPRDCQYQNFTYWELLRYSLRVNLMRYPDECIQYYRESYVDPFYQHIPVEAISEAVARFIFHPMGYIGSKLGDFFGEFTNAFPWWMRPIVLFIVCVMIFLYLVPYKIKSPFLSIEPAYRQEPTAPPHPQIQNQLQGQLPPQIVDVAAPNMIVPLRRLDAATDTDDLEEFIRQQHQERNERQHQMPPRASRPPPLNFVTPSWLTHLWTLFLPRFQEFGVIFSRFLWFLGSLLRETPTIPPSPEPALLNNIQRPQDVPENYD